MNTIPSPPLLAIDGEVERSRTFTFEDLTNIDPACQIPDVRQIEPTRQGTAVTLAALLDSVGVKPTGTFLTVHASADDFHASVPLESVRDRAIVIYRLGDRPLPVEAGGPVRLWIRDFASCHAAEVDECANVKFVDRIELTDGRGQDNRPQDDEQHEALHRGE